MKFRHEAVLDASQRVAPAVWERRQPAFRYPALINAIAADPGHFDAADA